MDSGVVNKERVVVGKSTSARDLRRRRMMLLGNLLQTFLFFNFSFFFPRGGIEVLFNLLSRRARGGVTVRTCGAEEVILQHHHN
jgi:hypothetical protein